MELNTYIFDSERYLCCEFGINFLLEDIPFEALNNLILKQRNLFYLSCRCVEKMCCERYQSAVSMSIGYACCQTQTAVVKLKAS